MDSSFKYFESCVTVRAVGNRAFLQYVALGEGQSPCGNLSPLLSCVEFKVCSVGGRATFQPNPVLNVEGKN